MRKMLIVQYFCMLRLMKERTPLCNSGSLRDQANKYWKNIKQTLNKKLLKCSCFTILC